MPRVSIILPTYNRAAMVREAIESVLAQTFTDWELIVINDGSTDDTEAVVAAFVQRDARIRYVRQPNLGLGQTRARSIGFCRGEFIALLDDDDLFLPEKLERQVIFLRRHPEVAMVHSYVRVVSSETPRIEREPQRPAREFTDLIDDCPVHVAGVLIRRMCFERLGSFRADLSMSADHEMWLRISRSFPIAFLPGIVGVYRRHGANMTLDYFKTYEETLRIYRELLQSGLPAAASRRVLDARRRTVAERALRHYQVAAARRSTQRYREAAGHYLSAIQYDPRIGARVPWGRTRSRLYRFLRPYAAFAYCAGAAALSGDTGQATTCTQ